MALIHNRFAQQIVLGTASGWFMGYCVKSVGRVAAGVAGSGLILWHIAEYNGVIPSDWKKQTEEQSARLQEQMTPTINNMKQFIKSKRTFAVGFVGGFFLGIAV